jgi:hypothetical protein
MSGAILSFLRWLSPLFSFDIFSIRYFKRGSGIELRPVRWHRELVSVVEKNRVGAYFCLFSSKFEDGIRVWTTSENHHPKPTNLIPSTAMGSGNLSGINLIIQFRTEFLARLNIWSHNGFNPTHGFTQCCRSPSALLWLSLLSLTRVP